MNKWLITCCSCRCTIEVSIESYPLGPDEPRCCPICGDKDKDSVRITQMRTIEFKQPKKTIEVEDTIFDL